jgi:hypothetical protein
VYPDLSQDHIDYVLDVVDDFCRPTPLRAAV